METEHCRTTSLVIEPIESEPVAYAIPNQNPSSSSGPIVHVPVLQAIQNENECPNSNDSENQIDKIDS